MHRINGKRRMVFVTLLGLTACGGDASDPSKTALSVTQPVALIIDTDFSSDVDDVGALAIANTLVDQGEAKLLAVMVNTPSRWGAPAVNAVNTWYGHADIPVGTLQPVDDSEPSTPGYPKLLASSFPNSLKDGANAPDAVALYRQILAQQPDRSVVIASIGYLTNLAALLASGPDANSNLDGRALVAKKVQFLDLMGGRYPSGYEWNFYSQPAATQVVVSNWPTRVIYNGFEVGATIMTGSRVLAESPTSSPVHAAYALYLGTQTSRPSWDPVSIYTAARGTDALFSLGGLGGANYVFADGGNSYTTSDVNAKNDAYLLKRQSDAAIAAKLDALMVKGPKP